MAFRSREQRIEIVRSILAEGGAQPLSDHDLDEKEEQFFRARAAKATTRLVDETGTFKAYYRLPTEKPFSRLLLGAGAMIVLCLIAFVVVYRNAGATPPYPVYAALISIVALAAGWIVTNDISHRNAVRQNTSSMIFARFTQAPFSDALHRFHSAFGYQATPRVTAERMAELRDSEDEGERQIAASVSYLLNYYEFIAAGVIRGDLDARVVRENIRGVINYYYDKCLPHIEACCRRNSSTYEHLRKIRASYRDV